MSVRARVCVCVEINHFCLHLIWKTEYLCGSRSEIPGCIRR